jgi:hypothetical protein
VERYGTAGQATDDKWYMRFAFWITKLTNTHSEYITLIAFPLQQWLQEHASLLRKTYSACHVTGVKGMYQVGQNKNQRHMARTVCLPTKWKNVRLRRKIYRTVTDEMRNLSLDLTLYSRSADRFI